MGLRYLREGYLYRVEAENCEYRHQGKMVEQTVELAADERKYFVDWKYNELKEMVSCPFNGNLHDHRVTTLYFIKNDTKPSNDVSDSRYAKYADADKRAVIFEERCVPSGKRVITTTIKQGNKVATEILGGSLVWKAVA